MFNNYTKKGNSIAEFPFFILKYGILLNYLFNESEILILLAAFTIINIT